MTARLVTCFNFLVSVLEFSRLAVIFSVIMSKSKVLTIHELIHNTPVETKHVQLHVKVIQKSDTTKYNNSEGREKQVTKIHVADGTGFIPVWNYSPDIERLLKVDRGLKIENFIYKLEGGVIVTTKLSKVFGCLPPNVSDEILDDYERSKESVSTPIKELLQKPIVLGKKYSVKGQIISVSANCVLSVVIL